MIIKWLNQDSFDYNRSSLSSESDCECMSSSSTRYMNVAAKFFVQVLGTAT